MPRLKKPMCLCMRHKEKSTERNSRVRPIYSVCIFSNPCVAKTGISARKVSFSSSVPPNPHKSKSRIRILQSERARESDGAMTHQTELDLMMTLRRTVRVLSCGIVCCGSM